MGNIRQPNNNGRGGIFKATVFALLLATGCLLVLPGCRNPLEPPQHIVKNETGTLSLTVGGRGEERTIMPGSVLDDFVTFNLRFVARSEGNLDFSKVWAGNTGIELDVGVWDLHVTAYLAGGEGGENLEAARGNLLGIYVPTGETVSGNVRLYPVTEGEGTFSWDIGFPENVVTVRMEITRIYWGGEPYSRVYYLVADGKRLLADRHCITLPAGRYRVVITLVNDLRKRAVASEILHVYRNMASVFAPVFDGHHFIGLSPELGLAEWLAVLRNFAQSGGEYVIELMGDEYISPAAAALPTGRTDLTITLRGVGYEPSNVRLSANGSLFTVGSGVTLVLDRNVTLEGRTNSASLVGVANGGMFVMNDGTMVTGNTASNSSGGVRVANGGTFVMNDGAMVTGNTATRSDSGGGVRVEGGGTFVMNDGAMVTGNTGIGVSLSGATFTMHGGEVSGNTHSGVAVGSYSTFTMYRGEISGNRGGVSVDIHGAFTMDDGTISYNTGTGVSLSGATFTMHGGEISGNTNRGVTVDSVPVLHEHRLLGGTFTMAGGRIFGNTTMQAGHGAGVSVSMAGTFVMYGGEIFGNTATGSGSGGGVSIGNGTFRIINGIIFGNEAEHGDRRNTATGANSFAALSIFGSSTIQHGTFDGGHWRSNGPLTSRNVTIHVRDGVLLSEAIPIISIITQPAAITNVTAGSISGSLSVVASVTQGASLSFQWFRTGFPSNAGGTVVDGATGSSLAIPTDLQVPVGYSHFFFVEVRATGEAIPVRSNPARVVVSPAPVITITTHPVATTNVTMGSISGSLTVAASVTREASLSFQWFRSTTNSNVGGTAISGATGASFAIPTDLAAGNHFFFAEARAAGAAPVRSGVARVNVALPAPVITITAQPAATTNVTAGSIGGSLTVAASVTQGASLSYQWFSNTTNSNVGGTPISGATGASFTIPAGLAVGTHFYFVEVRASGGATPRRSNVAVVNVNVSSIFTIGFADFVDMAPDIAITGPTLRLVGTPAQTSATINVTNPGQYDPGSIRWLFRGTPLPGNMVSGTNGGTLTLRPIIDGNILGEGTHFLTVEVRVNGVPFSRRIAFNVVW